MINSGLPEVTPKVPNQEFQPAIISTGTDLLGKETYV